MSDEDGSGILRTIEEGGTVVEKHQIRNIECMYHSSGYLRLVKFTIRKKHQGTGRGSRSHSYELVFKRTFADDEDKVRFEFKSVSFGDKSHVNNDDLDMIPNYKSFAAEKLKSMFGMIDEVEL